MTTVKRAALFLALALAAAAQEPGVGKFLVASRDLGDPNFAETVVLLVHYDEEGVAGLVINRRTRVPIARALEEVKAAKDRSDPIYLGGPVGRTGVMALLRSRAKIDGAEHVFGDVYLVTKAAALEKALATSGGADSLRVYLGYAGWTADQLNGELSLGAWRILPANAATVFSADPDMVWTRLIEQTEQRIATRIAAPLPDRCGWRGAPAAR